MTPHCLWGIYRQNHQVSVHIASKPKTFIRVCAMYSGNTLLIFKAHRIVYSGVIFILVSPMTTVSQHTLCCTFQPPACSLVPKWLCCKPLFTMNIISYTYAPIFVWNLFLLYNSCSCFVVAFQA